MQETPRLCPSRTSKNDEALLLSQQEGYRGPKSASELSKEKVILGIDNNFIVLNKPHDLRMDGDFELTVQKLLLQWTGLPLSELKWVHQLDYATSGTLAVARTREMAGLASNAFEFRETHKEYLAIVEGHINYNQWPEAKENAKAEDIAHTTEKVDSVDKKSHVVKALVSEEHEAVRNNNVKIYYDALQLALSSTSSSTRGHDAELEELGRIPISDYYNPKSSKLRKRLRKALRHTEYLSQMEQDAGAKIITAPPSKKRRDNCIDSDFADQMDDKAVQDMVSLLHNVTEGSQNVIERVNVEGKMAIRINAAIAEVEGDFRMELGHDANPGRASQTTLYILGHTFYQGRPVTKVLLHPKSGRRHQLRLHTRAMGHPIVGDITYGSKYAKNAERMMLHSYKLVIPIPKKKWKGSGPPTKLVNCVAPPFFSTSVVELNDVPCAEYV